jgi:hypothetical protein
MGKQGAEAGVIVSPLAEGEDVRGLSLDPFVQFTISELKRFLDMDLNTVRGPVL